SSPIPAAVAVIDPNGVIVASNATDVSNGLGDRAITVAPSEKALAFADETFAFTAELPGTYTFAIGFGLLGAGLAPGGGAGTTLGAIDTTTLLSETNYTLTIAKASDLALGAVIVQEDFRFAVENEGLVVSNGDLGTIRSIGGLIVNDGFDFTEDLIVNNGNLRELDANQIGRLEGGIISDDPNIFVPDGSVGRLFADTYLSFNQDALTDDFTGYDPSFAIGGDFQYVETGGVYGANLIADGSIGVVRVNGNVTVPFNPVFATNADGSGDDGVLDLLDVSGQLGTSDIGGPIFSPGPGGNIRYVRVGGTAFRDPFFGGGAPDTVSTEAGTPVTLTDDSGTEFTITPADTVTDPTLGNSLTVRTLPVRGNAQTGAGGGVITLDITTNGSVRIDADAREDSSVEIGFLNIQDFTNTTPIVSIDPTTGLPPGVEAPAPGTGDGTGGDTGDGTGDGDGDTGDDTDGDTGGGTPGIGGSFGPGASGGGGGGGNSFGPGAAGFGPGAGGGGGVSSSSDFGPGAGGGTSTDGDGNIITDPFPLGVAPLFQTDGPPPIGSTEDDLDPTLSSNVRGLDLALLPDILTA
ncbi:MAG: hypothetical protein AAF743_16060, partial [Planctomycetota bacterium]